jgi:hypothetical protein
MNMSYTQARIAKIRQARSLLNTLEVTADDIEVLNVAQQLLKTHHNMRKALDTLEAMVDGGNIENGFAVDVDKMIRALKA